jgi:hypothetical protein
MAERILVVEDEEPIRKIMVSMRSAQGSWRWQTLWIRSHPICLTVTLNLWVRQEKKFDAGQDASAILRSLIRSFRCPTIAIHGRAHNRA